MKFLGLEINRSQPKVNPNQEERASLTEYLSYFGIPLSNNGSTVTDVTALTISAVYKSVTMISDSIASLPLEPYILEGDIFKVDRRHPSYNLLNVQPHPMYGKFNFWKTLVANVLLHGNGYAYIKRNGNGDPLNFILLEPTDVEIYINEEQNQIKYKLINKHGFIDPTDMIHILNYSDNGYSGTSVIEHGSRSMGIAIASDKTSKGFFENGANASGIIKVDGRIDPNKAAAIKNSWNTAFSPYNDNTTPGGVVVLEKGMDYQPISINPVDAQLLQVRQWNVDEVARWFNIPASKLGVTNGLNYNSIEQNQIEYLQTTLTPFIEKIENELERKLFRPSVRETFKARFDENALLRTDLDSKVSYLSKCIDNGLMSINEGRKNLGLEPVEDGDTIIIKSGNQPLSNLLNPPVEQSAPMDESERNVEQSAPKRQRTKNKKRG